MLRMKLMLRYVNSDQQVAPVLCNLLSSVCNKRSPEEVIETATSVSVLLCVSICKTDCI